MAEQIVVTSTAEAALRRRVFRRLLLFIMPAVLIAFMDRVDISFAAPTMNPAIGIDSRTFGIGVGIFFLGYMLFEIPSNMLMAKVGARFWLSRIMIAWGVASVALSQAAGPASFLGLRFLLGVAEAGFLPGIMLYASYWVSTRQLGVFNSWMLLMIPIAGSITALVSGLILSLHEWLGLAGWQWIFILEGLPAVLLGIYGLCSLPSRPQDAHWLSPSEKDWVEREARGVAGASPQLSGKTMLKAFANRRTWIYAGAYFAMNFALGAQPWLPLLLAPFKLTGMQIGVLLAAANGLAALSMVVWGWQSDRSGERCNHLLLASVVSAIGWALCGVGEASLAIVTLGTVLALGGMYAALVVFWTLPTASLAEDERPVGIALVTCVGLLSSFVAPTLSGWLKHVSGSYQGGMYLAALGMILTAVTVREGARWRTVRGCLGGHDTSRKPG